MMSCHPVRTLTRRAFTALGASAVLAKPAAAFKVPVGQQIACRIIRGGRDIGETTYSFVQNGDALTVRIAMDLAVKLGFMTLFRYSHTNEEHWQGQQLMRFDSHTNNNGRNDFAAASWNGAALDVTGSRTTPYTAPPHALGTSYWNPRTLTDPLVNSQDGKLLAVRMTDVGPSEAVLSTGKTVAATEYRMTGDLRANIWYDDAMTWSGMQYYAHDGSILTYEKA